MQERNCIAVEIKKNKCIFELSTLLDHIEGKLAVSRNSLLMTYDCPYDDIDRTEILGAITVIDDARSELSQLRKQVAEA